MLLGCTGAGKTTFLQYISGVTHKLEKLPLKEGGSLSHYAVESYPANFDPALKELVTSPHSISCTSCVTPIEVPYKKSKRDMKSTWLDTPGIEETRSAE